MPNKIIKLFKIILATAILFSSVSSASYAYSPYVSTGSATAITSNSATLNGSVNADNMPTSVWFEYGTDSGLKNSFSINAYRYSSGYSGNLVANVVGLSSNTTYYFRAVAQNSEGRVYGNIFSFITNSYYPVLNDIYTVNNTPLILTAITEPANLITSASVQLNSLIYNEANSASNTWFEWGTTINLGNKTTIIQTGVLPSIKHADTLTKLSPGTTYYFRAVAENSTLRNNGSILSFVTKQSTGTSAISTNTTIKANTNTETTEKKGGASFFPADILGWLFSIILMLALILIGKHLYRKFLNKEQK